MGGICNSPTQEILTAEISVEPNVEYLRVQKEEDLHVEFDDLSMAFSPTFISSDCGESVFNTSVSTLPQVVKFKIGGRLLCMSWNLHHDFESTPFDCYWDLWSLALSENDRGLIGKFWDGADVFFNLEKPTEICRSTALKSVVPSFLLSPKVLEKFCTSGNLSTNEREEVMRISNASIYTFLLLCSGSKGSFLNIFNTHLKYRQRTTSPLQRTYNSADFNRLLEKDISILPVLILDSLHVLVIRFTTFLSTWNLQKEFSECFSNSQTELFSMFKAGPTPDNILDVPRQFKEMKRRLYKQWNSLFEDKNIIQQIWSKALAADIILLQGVRKGTYNQLSRQFSGVYSLIPNKFPAGEKDTTVICLLKSTVHLQEKKKKIKIDQHNFAVLCKSYDILYYIAAVSLTDLESSLLKRKVMTKLVRSIGTKRPLIFGGDFGADLTGNDTQIAGEILKNYNGINYKQRSPFLVSRTRSHVNLEMKNIGKPCVTVTDGIFSSFPLVDEAFTDFKCWGENISDHAPVFQEIQLGLF